MKTTISVLLIALFLVSLGSYSLSAQDPSRSIVTFLLQAFTSHTDVQATAEVSFNSNLTFSVIPNEVNVAVDDVFSINITLHDAVDMYAWQVHLYYEPSIIECVGVSVPGDYVVAYARSSVAGRTLAEYNSTEFRNPLQRTFENWVLAGDCLLGRQAGFTGSGILCQIKFKAISPGVSPLTLSTNSNWFGTYVLNSAGVEEDQDVIVPDVLNGIVIVSG